jgi:magnesium and cobalt exporter, CNNM family
MIRVLALIALAFALVALSISLAAVEAAFYLVKRRRLAHLAVNNPRAELVNRYLEDPPSLLMPIHIGTYTAHVAITVVVTALFLDHLQQWAMVVAFGVMVIYLLLLRLTLPYSLVRRNPERSLLLLLPGFHVYAQMLGPLVTALRRRARGEPAATSADEEMPTAVPEVPPAPVHDPDEDRMTEAVIRFATTNVKDVMTPRPDIVALPADSTVGDLTRLIRETKYSRIPVFGENLDDVVGVVTVRDLIEHEGDAADPLRPLVRPALLVPETKRVAELLKEFQAGRITFAMVIDEYGGTAGLVTVEDIVEEIVGEIKDEYDLEAEPIVVEPDGAVLVAGRVNVDRLEQALEVPLADGDDVDTVGGLVATAFGRVPRTGERIDFKGFTVEVVSAEHKRVNRVRFRRKLVPVEAS